MEVCLCAVCVLPAVTFPFGVSLLKFGEILRVLQLLLRVLQLAYILAVYLLSRSIVVPSGSTLTPSQR